MARKPEGALRRGWTTGACATAAVVKDAGDDPDVSHGALVVSTVRQGAPGSGVSRFESLPTRRSQRRPFSGSRLLFAQR